jgi:hypothetical protein
MARVSRGACVSMTEIFVFHMLDNRKMICIILRKMKSGHSRPKSPAVAISMCSLFGATLKNKNTACVFFWVAWGVDRSVGVVVCFFFYSRDYNQLVCTGIEQRKTPFVLVYTAKCWLFLSQTPLHLAEIEGSTAALACLVWPN